MDCKPRTLTAILLIFFAACCRQDEPDCHTAPRGFHQLLFRKRYPLLMSIVRPYVAPTTARTFRDNLSNVGHLVLSRSGEIYLDAPDVLETRIDGP